MTQRAWGEAAPRHLQVKHKGEALQEVDVVRLEGVGPAQVLGGRGEVTELGVGFRSQGVEFYLRGRKPRLLSSPPQFARRLDTQLPAGTWWP